MTKFQITTLLIVVAAAISCGELETYSETPQVEFKQVYLADTVDALDNYVKHQRITLEIIDGDGNLGLNDSDTTGQFSPESQYYHNLFITIYNKKADGTYDELTLLSQNTRYRIPYKAPIGQNKYLKAEVRIDMDVPLSYFDYDTIRYDFQIFDRDLNASTIATSCDIPARQHGTVWADGHGSFFPEEEDIDEELEQNN